MIDMTLAWESAQSRGVLQVGKVVSAVNVEIACAQDGVEGLILVTHRKKNVATVEECMPLAYPPIENKGRSAAP